LLMTSVFWSLSEANISIGTHHYFFGKDIAYKIIGYSLFV
jgi:hypothetical protein